MRAYIDSEDFPRRFASLFKHSAYRLELLDAYQADNEAEHFGAFLAGKPIDPAWRHPWQTFVRTNLAAGKTMSRVHAVTEPLSDYLRFELTQVYPANVDAGEDVRIMLAGVTPAPERDYWLIDDQWLALMIYDAGGAWYGAELTDDRSEVAAHRRWRDQAIAHSVPLHEYLARSERRTA